MEAIGWLETAVRDFRYSWRMLGRSPGFTAVAALTLALGIGANTAIFTLLDQVLLRLLPVKEPSQLVLLEERGHHYGSNWGSNAISFPMYRDFQAHNEVFSGMFARFAHFSSVTMGRQAERAETELVSGTYFGVLGVGPAAGRTITPDDDRVPNGHPVVMLSYKYWKQRFGGDPNIVNSTILVNNQKMTVIGVAQQGFDGVELGYSPKIFIPLMMVEQILIGNKDMLTDRRNRWVNTFGRLKPSVTRTQAQAALQPSMHAMLEMEVREAAFAHASPYDREQFLKCWIAVKNGAQGQQGARDSLTAPMWVLMATTGFVLMIACANIANLLLARATRRQKEMAIRLAIGASRPRIVGQLLMETLSLSALGAVIGLALAFWADKALLHTYMPADTRNLSISAVPDLRVLAFTLAITTATGLAFGLVPALQASKPDVGRTLKDEGSAVVGGGGNKGLRKSLVVVQVALSLLLLTGAGLFLRSLNNLSKLGPGFNPERLVGFNLDPSMMGYKPPQTKIAMQQLAESLRTIPGVQAVGLATNRILENNEWDSGMTVEGYNPDKPDDRAQPFMNQVAPGYFATLGVSIVMGRDFTRADNKEVKHGDGDFWVPNTVIINEKFARKYFAGRNPIGMHIGFGSDPGTPTDMEVVGVVKDIKYTNLRDDIPEQAFLPFLASRYINGMTVYVRTTLDPNPLLNAVRLKVRDLDPNLPIFDMRTTEQQISNSLSAERMIASLSTVFGFLATGLAGIGLYGVMAYTVMQRTREIGIRMALGAESKSVIWMVMRDVLLLIAAGVGIGVPAALGLSQGVKSQLYGLDAHDPVTLVQATTALIVVACAAGYIPALRASRLDPMAALRYE